MSVHLQQAVHGHAHSSSVLIGNGADVTLVDDYGYSPVEVTTNKKLHRVLKGKNYAVLLIISRATSSLALGYYMQIIK